MRPGLRITVDVNVATGAASVRLLFDGIEVGVQMAREATGVYSVRSATLADGVELDDAQIGDLVNGSGAVLADVAAAMGRAMLDRPT